MPNISFNEINRELQECSCFDSEPIIDPVSMILPDAPFDCEHLSMMETVEQLRMRVGGLVEDVAEIRGRLQI